MKRKRFYVMPALILILLIILASVTMNRKNEKDLVQLEAGVKYADKKFVITNKDTTDFIHATISIDNYYKIRDYNLKAGETYTIWQIEFLYHNGMHYPIEKKPSRFSIWCETQSGKNGFFTQKIR